MADQKSSKKTLGRRKIEIKKIEKKSSLQVTFAKRKKSLFTKASELSLLCGADMAILVTSPANKVFGFGNPDVGSVIHRFQTRLAISPVTSSYVMNSCKYSEAVRRLEEEKSKKELYELQGMGNWWDRSVEGMELQELEEYLEALEGLKNRVFNRLGKIEEKTDTNWVASSSSNLSESGNSDHNGTDEFIQALLKEPDFDEGHISFEDVKLEAQVLVEKKFFDAGGSSSSNFVGNENIWKL